jgi:hypothetical protein
MEKNQLQHLDRAIHDWYRFVLAYPPHLVREYLGRLEADPERDVVLDPFSGTATTPLEARLQGYAVIGVDANPVAVLANRVKLNWDIDLDAVGPMADRVVVDAARYLQDLDLAPLLATDGQASLFGDRAVDLLRDSSAVAAAQQAEHVGLGDYVDADVEKVLPRGFISPKPLHRVLALRHAIERLCPPGGVYDFLRLALGNTILASAANVAFGPEIYASKPKEDADVLNDYYETVRRMKKDLAEVIAEQSRPHPDAQVWQDDARHLHCLSGHTEIGLVITSPPYPNEKDYTRTTRLENVLLGYIGSRRELRELKENLLRSNTRNVFVADDDEQYVQDIPAVVRLAEIVEEKRLALGKTSGFEKLYHRVVLNYFGGMYRHLVALRPHLRPGARLAYVVGDQMSFFRVHIKTAELLAEVAIKAGYRVEGIEGWRNRFSTVTRRQLEENVLILQWPE